MPKTFAAHTALDRQNPCQSDVKLNLTLCSDFLIYYTLLCVAVIVLSACGPSKNIGLFIDKGSR